MDSKFTSNFGYGLTIAYLVPGFTVLQGLPFLFKDTANWGILGRNDPTLSGLLSGTMEALATGLTVSSVRWLVIDWLHHRMGIKPPQWDFATLKQSTEAFQLLVQNHYHYYKFHANMTVALVWAYAAGGYALGWKGLLYWLLGGLFFLGSRDCLKKYYDRSGQLLDGGA